LSEGHGAQYGFVFGSDAANRKLRFDDSYLKLAAAGQL
jgi:hypothetical protein